MLIIQSFIFFNIITENKLNIYIYVNICLIMACDQIGNI